MDLSPGVWVDVGDDRVALVDGWDETTGTAVAETPSGLRIERPISFARQRWTVVPEHGLRVAASLAPDATVRLAETDPIAVVALALHDLQGRGETSQIRDLLSPRVVPPDDWDAWWRRAQVKFEDDDRIDTSRSRDKIYALAGHASALGRALVPALQEERRRGRRMADGPQLKRARDRAQQPGPRTLEDDALFLAELALADDASVDPTDRFMAAELGIWLERWSVDKAREKLGDDAAHVDLLRIPAHESRTLALDFATNGDGFPMSSIARSGIAAGPPWSDRILDDLSDRPPALRHATFGFLGWAVPGDDDAGPAKLKEDLPTYERRIAAARSIASSLPPDGRLGLWDGALHALAALPREGVYAAQLARLRTEIALLAWSAYDAVESERRPLLRDLSPMDRDAFAPFLRAAPGGERRILRDVVARWYADDPGRQFDNVRLLGSEADEDVLALGLAASRDAIVRTSLPAIAAQLLQVVTTSGRIDATANAVVNLAVTTLGDSPQVNSAMDRLAEEIMRTYDAAGTSVPGPVTFSRPSWERFGALLAARLDDAAATEARAKRDVEAARDEVERATSLADQRAQALTEARSTASTERGQDVGRLASSLLRPVALAVADSFEADSLEVLQDRLLAVLGRARIRQILEVGETAVFDPTRHQWVGDGSPTVSVVARSPGFLIAEEGGHEVVLVPARVVAAAST